MPLSCYVHPRSSAEDRCAGCRRTICPACVVAAGHMTMCRSCAEQAAKRRRGLFLLAGALVLAAGLAALVVGAALG